MAVLPTRLLEIEFDAGVWTDVFADVVDISTRRGRNRESGSYETGTMTFTVRNDARKYDPEYTSVYYGKLRPNRRVRFRATYNAITYPVFLGYVDRITQNYGGPNDATATFTTSDRFKILNRIDLASSVYVAEVLADTPAAWWRLGESAGTVAVDATGNGQDLAYVNGPTFNSRAGLVGNDPDNAIEFVDGIEYAEGTPRGTTGGAFTIEAWIKLPAVDGPRHTDDGSDTIYSNAGGGSLSVDHRSLPTLGQLSFGGATAKSSVRVDDDVVHHVAVTQTAGGTTAIYVDGVNVTTGAGPGAMTTSPGLVRIGRNPSTPAGWDAIIGTLDDVAVYNTALSAARIAAHNDAARAPWNGELPGARLARILALAGLTAPDYSLDVGTTTLQATSLGGTALGYAQKVEETEAGYLFVDRAGVVRFIGRDAAVTGTYLTSQATLVDHVGGGLPYRSASSDVDESTIVTRATVSREGGVAATHSDTAAIAEFQIIDETHDGLLHSSDAYSLSYAQWIVSTHRAPASRLGQLSMDLPADPPNLYPGILGRELAERVTYKRQPQNVAPTIDVPMRIEAIAHETGGAYWRTNLQLSPFNMGQDGYGVGVWDVSLWDQAVWGI